MSYGQDLIDNWRRAATFVDKILKAPNPPISVEQALKFEFIVNLKPRNRSAWQFRRTCWRGRIG